MEQIDNKIYIECDCGTHLLRMEFDNELESDPSFYLAMFEYSGGRSTWKWRLKLIWKIFKTGNNHSDQIIFGTDQAKKLKNFLEANIKN